MANHAKNRKMKMALARSFIYLRHLGIKLL